MADVKITRASAEVLADGGGSAKVTRLDSEVAAEAAAASGEDARVTRVSVEVLGARPPQAGLTRLDAEVAAEAAAASGEDVAVTRVSVEVLGNLQQIANVSRLDAEVAAEATAASTGAAARVTRVALEVLARGGSAGPVAPLALSTEIDAFLHNWVSGAVMTTSFLTSVTQSASSAAEARRGLVLKPEREIEVYWQSDDDAVVERMLNFLRHAALERMAVPIYMDQAELDQAYLSTDTVLSVPNADAQYRLFNGQRVMIAQLGMDNRITSTSYHLVSVVGSNTVTLTAQLGVAVPAGSLLFPCMDCEVLRESVQEYDTGCLVGVRATFNEVAGASQLPALKSDTPTGADTFDGVPIFAHEPDWSSRVLGDRLLPGKRFRRGRTEVVYAAAARSRQGWKMSFAGNRASQFPVLEFFETRRGRLRSFWLVDQTRTWNLEAIAAGGGTLSITDTGDLASVQEELEGEWVGLVMEDGTHYVREVTTVVDAGSTFTINLDTNLPAGLLVTDAVRVSRARRVRFDSDSIKEEWAHTGYMKTDLEFVETLDEDIVTT